MTTKKITNAMSHILEAASILNAAKPDDRHERKRVIGALVAALDALKAGRGRRLRHAR